MQDLRLAFRQLRASPVASAVAVLSLALGIGANTAIFSLLDRLVLRPLPVRHAERLAVLVDAERPGASWSNPVWEQLRDRLDLFDGGFAWFGTEFNLAQGGEVRLVDGLWASGGFFDTLGVQAYAGRLFTTADDMRGGGPDGPVAVISHEFWQRHFGGAAEAIGTPLAIGEIDFTVIGVTPPGFFGPDVGRTFDVALPLCTEPLLRGNGSALDLRGRNWLDIMLRLAPGQTVEAATTLVRGLQPQIREHTIPDLPAELVARYLRGPLALAPGSNGVSPLRTRFQQPLVILMMVVAAVLLIACANVANLLLARAAARRREVSVRVSLGASRWRLARQLLIESLVLAGISALLGLFFARWTTGVLVTQLSTAADPVFLDLALDWRVLAFTTAVAIGTAVLFGTAPAWQATFVEARESLNEQSRGPAGGTRSRVAGTLVATQVALSMMLVVAAGLFVRTFVALTTLDPGFTTERTLIVRVTSPMTRFKAEDLTAVYMRVLDAVEAVPGVEHAALSDITPIGGLSRVAPVVVPGVELVDAADRLASVNVVSPGWFTTYGAPLLAGRDFGEQDRLGAPQVAIVNQAFARRFFNGEHPLGRIVRTRFGDGPPIEIVGYSADASYRSLREPPPPTLYTAFAQRPLARPFVAVTVRTLGAPAALTSSVAAAIDRVSPDLELQFQPLSEQVTASLAQERVVAALAGFFGGLALLLAGLGLYGVTTHAVSQRRAEIGIRMALGAARAGIISLILRRVVVVVSIGLAVGCILSWWAARFVAATLLYGLEPRDPGVLVAAATVLALVGGIAGWLPAHRAAELNPVEALRAE
jgi:putative ABC transport system permease protein